MTSLKDDAKRMGAKLARDWIRAFATVASPYTLTLLALGVALIGASYLVADPRIEALLGAMIAVDAGALGGILTHSWIRSREETTLSARGTGALRELNHLHGQIRFLRERIGIYVERMRDQESADDLITGFEELQDRCQTLEDVALNAIEQWQDILPEAAIREKFGRVRKLESQIQSVQEERDSLEHLAQEETAGREELKTQLDEKDKQVKDLKQQLAKERARFGGPLYGLGSEPGTLSSLVEGTFELSRNCRECGHAYRPGFFDTGKCPDCETKSDEPLPSS